MGIGLRVNQLNIDPHLIGHFLHATLKNRRYAKLLRDLGEIARSALYCCVDVREITFKSAILDQRQNFILDTVGKVGVGFVFAPVLKWHDCD